MLTCLVNTVNDRPDRGYSRMINYSGHVHGLAAFVPKHPGILIVVKALCIDSAEPEACRYVSLVPALLTPVWTCYRNECRQGRAMLSVHQCRTVPNDYC